MKRINISLTTPGSLNSAIEYLKQYNMEQKAKQFIEELAQIGIKALSVNVNSISPYYKGEDLDVSLKFEDDGMKAVITMSGKNCAFIEFGSGILFNVPIGESKHPKGKELGFTIGSYNPGSANAGKRYGWWYTDENGTRQHSYGTPTFAPMHNSEMEMIRDIKKVFIEVFGNG